ncbi:hypothetical protein J6590_065077 [Homalodisca vitripennis]|nr:hypothetical protein J6590_065077 [Homalodisca vitripennis]
MLEVRPITRELSCIISYSPLPAHNRVHKVRVKLTACYITWINVTGSTHNQRALMYNIFLSSPCPQQSAQSSGQADSNGGHKDSVVSLGVSIYVGLIRRAFELKPLEELKTVCNRTVTLTAEQPRASVTSPGFPRTYPDNIECHTTVLAPHGYRLVVDFDELILEDERLDFCYTPPSLVGGSLVVCHPLPSIICGTVSTCSVGHKALYTFTARLPNLSQFLLHSSIIGWRLSRSVSPTSIHHLWYCVNMFSRTQGTLHIHGQTRSSVTVFVTLRHRWVAALSSFVTHFHPSSVVLCQHVL